MAPLRILLAGVFLIAAACSRNDARPDDAQKMVAYAVKPAVVRINALATASFRYPPEAIEAAAAALHLDGYDVVPVQLDEGGVVETGAGGSGSGFIVHPDGFILTSGHVVAPTRDRAALERELRRNGAIAALVRHLPIEALRAVYRDGTLDRYVGPLAARGVIESVSVVARAELSNGESLPYTILRWSPALNERGTDLALLTVDRRDLPSLPLGRSDTVRIGASIFSVGYPAVASSSDEVIGGWLSSDTDLEATFNPGTITAIRRNIANTPVFQSNVAIYRGNSGGPAVNLDGEVIGVSTWGHTDAEQIKFLVPVDVARRFMLDAGVTPSVGGRFNANYRAALDAARAGRWSSVNESLAIATSVFPQSPDLIRFGRDADLALAAMPLWRRQPALAAGAGGVALLIAAAGIVGLVRMRTTKTPSRPQARVPVDRREHQPLPSTTEQTQTGSAGVLGRFTILNGTRAGERLGLGGSGIRIGREAGICEIVLENPKVSRLHAEVVSLEGRVLLIDRNSSNGTYVNDQKIDQQILQDGDIIYFGGRTAVAVAFHA